jgi:TorA maturation chaperone TorD
MATTDEATLEQEQRYRASAYALLAALLRAPPDQALLDHVVALSPESDAEPDELSEAMSKLAAAARTIDLSQLEDEYNALFIGIGKGEVVPYGSWYLTGFLMEQPLEDHIAAIFEVFSVMILDATSLAEQQRFSEKHMKPWLTRFFADLGHTRSADFYRFVAQFGAAFLELEQRYLLMRS